VLLAQKQCDLKALKQRHTTKHKKKDKIIEERGTS
jgi:hypothetical protein